MESWTSLILMAMNRKTDCCSIMLDMDIRRINCWLYLGEDYSVDFKEGGGIGQCVGTSWEGYNEMGVRSSTNIEMLKLIKFIISFRNI